MPAGRHRDLAELAAGGPVELHVTTGHGRVELHRGERAHRHLELADDAELRHLADAGADPAARGPVAAERDEDVTADAGRDHRQGACTAATALAPPMGVVAEKQRSGMPKLVTKSSATTPLGA